MRHSAHTRLLLLAAGLLQALAALSRPIPVTCLFPLYVLFAAFTLVYVFSTHTRYRMLFEPFPILIAACETADFLRHRISSAGDVSPPIER